MVTPVPHLPGLGKKLLFFAGERTFRVTLSQESARINPLAMVRLLPVGLFAVVLTAGVFVPLSCAQDVEVQNLTAQETARRHAAIRDSLQQVQEARNAYSAQKYSDAVEHYRNALSVLPDAPATSKQREFIRASLSDALIARALDYRSVGRVEEAIDFLKEAVQLDPSNKRAKRELVFTEDPVRNNPALTPRHVGDVEEVHRLLNLANGYLDLGKYDDAIRTFHDVLRIDTYNEAARRGIMAVQKRRSASASTAYVAARAARMAEVDSMWDSVSRADIEESPPIPGIAEAPNSATEEQEKEDELAHAQALEQMIIPSINVEDADVMEVIDILRGHVRRFQSRQTAANQRPINIVAAFGTPDTPGYKQLMQRRRSFRLDNLSMKDLLTEISQLYEIDFYYVPMGVELTYAGQDYGRLVDRVFYVPPHFFDEGDSAEESDDTDEETFSSGGRVKVSRIDPVAALKKMNISFPKGASAVYRAASRRLTVRNTQRNIAQLEELLADVSPVEDKLIVLSIKVVETSQDNLVDLGFEWLLGIDMGSKLVGGGGTEQSASNAGGMPIPRPNNHIPNALGPVVTNNQRSIRQVLGQHNLDRLVKRGQIRDYVNESAVEELSPTIFGLRGVWASADVTMVMRGLSQKKGVDSLSNPKLIFTAGAEEQASLVNVREMYYPSRYDEPRISESMDQPIEDAHIPTEDFNKDGVIEPVPTPVYVGATAIAVGANPTDFVRYGVDEDNVGGIGTIVQVHNAEVSPDGQKVKLAITTIVNDFDGFVDWGSPIYAALPTDTTVERVKLSDNYIYQPLFKRYMTNTTITVEDGAVLVMGGMKEAKIVHYEDKVPILGDLPLVGRLFRNSGSNKQQKALLIFAKVNIVDPSGKNVRSADSTATAQSPM